MNEELLTARVLFRFLKNGVGQPAMSFMSRRLHVTQTTFWRNFLCSAVVESELLPYFDLSNGRSRALSNLFNRTVPHSMPVRLYRAAEDSLNPDTLLQLTICIINSLDADINPLSIHSALNALENRIIQAGFDTEFVELSDFFISLRHTGQDLESVVQKKLFIQAAFRFTMLGLHALYGDLMATSPALQRLRACRFCDPNTLFEGVSALAPRMESGGFSLLRTAELRPQPDADRMPDAALSDDELAGELGAAARAALPPPDIRREHSGPNAGWYVVANWLDIDIYVNDTPRATYDGAQDIGILYNGTLLYVLSAPGYRGIHVSGGVWGKIAWRGGIGWVPMNLLMKIDT